MYTHHENNPSQDNKHTHHLLEFSYAHTFNGENNAKIRIKYQKVNSIKVFFLFFKYFFIQQRHCAATTDKYFYSHLK